MAKGSAILTDGFALATHDGVGTLRRTAMSGARAVGSDGKLALPFNCSGMYRGYVKHDRIVYTAIYDETYRSA